MTNEEAKEVLAFYRFNLIQSTSNQLKGDIEAFDMAIKALEQQPNEDCISREAVLDYIEGSEADLWHDSENELVCQDIKALPSIIPQPKIGKWIKTYEPNDAEPCILWMCSKCQNAEHGIRSRSKYCPNCGSYNGGEKDGSD